MTLSWRKRLIRRRPRRPGLHLELLENRLVPSSTYMWTGAGATRNWDDPGNWAPASGAAGSFSATHKGAGVESRIRLPTPFPILFLFQQAIRRWIRWHKQTSAAVERR